MQMSGGVSGSRKQSSGQRLAAICPQMALGRTRPSGHVASSYANFDVRVGPSDPAGSQHKSNGMFNYDHSTNEQDEPFW